MIGGNVVALAGEPIPEVYERLREVHGGGANDAQMGVAPLSCVQHANIIAADKAHFAIDNEQLAVVKCIDTRIEESPNVSPRSKPQGMNVRGKLLECAWDEEVAENVEDDIYGDALLCLRRQVRLELPTDNIILPDERLYVNAFFSLIYGRKHSLIEVLPIGINVQMIGPYVRFRKSRARESRCQLAMFTSPGRQRENGDNCYLQCYPDRDDPQHDLPYWPHTTIPFWFWPQRTHESGAYVAGALSPPA